MENNILHDLFISLQKEMFESFGIGKNISHPVSHGDFSEENWIGFLKNFLPKRYNIDKAIIIDYKGNLSEQIDLVIYDQLYSPFIFNKNNIKYIPAESIYAVFEIKPELNKTNIDYAKNKIKSVRKLERSNAPIVHAGGFINENDLKRHFNIIGGILTYDFGIKNKGGRTFRNYFTKINKYERINIGLIINSMAFTIDYEPLIIRESSNKQSLLFFFLKLFSLLQKQGTASAIEINKWGSFLDNF